MPITVMHIYLQNIFTWIIALTFIFDYKDISAIILKTTSFLYNVLLFFVHTIELKDSVCKSNYESCSEQIKHAWQLRSCLKLQRPAEASPTFFPVMEKELILIGPQILKPNVFQTSENVQYLKVNIFIFNIIHIIHRPTLSSSTVWGRTPTKYINISVVKPVNSPIKWDEGRLQVVLCQ